MIIKKRDVLAFDPDIRTIHGIYTEDWDTFPDFQKAEIDRALIIYLSAQYREHFSVRQWYQEDPKHLGILFT